MDAERIAVLRGIAEDAEYPHRGTITECLDDIEGLTQRLDHIESLPRLEDLRMDTRPLHLLAKMAKDDHELAKELLAEFDAYRRHISNERRNSRDEIEGLQTANATLQAHCHATPNAGGHPIQSIAAMAYENQELAAKLLAECDAYGRQISEGKDTTDGN